MEFPQGFQWPEQLLCDPKTRRENFSKSSQSIGNDIALSIKILNDGLPEAKRIPVKIVCAKSLSNQVMRTAGTFLAANKVFSPYLGSHSFRQVQKSVDSPGIFWTALDEVIQSVVLRETVARASQGYWVARRAVINRLANEKNSARLRKKNETAKSKRNAVRCNSSHQTCPSQSVQKRGDRICTEGPSSSKMGPRSSSPTRLMRQSALDCNESQENQIFTHPRNDVHDLEERSDDGSVSADEVMKKTSERGRANSDDASSGKDGNRGKKKQIEDLKKQLALLTGINNESSQSDDNIPELFKSASTKARNSSAPVEKPYKRPRRFAPRTKNTSKRLKFSKNV